MNRTKDKFKRIVKYWRVSFQQASGRERLNIGMFALIMLVYTWWIIIVL